MRFLEVYHPVDRHMETEETEMPFLAALKIQPDNFNYILSTAVIVCQGHPIMINYICILLIHINVISTFCTIR